MARLIDPAVAAAAARRVAGEGGLAGSHLLEAVERDLAGAVPRAEALVAEASGIHAPGPVRWGVIGRGRWAEANIAGLAALMQPLADKVDRKLDSTPLALRIAQRTLVSVEIGVLLGYVARRVLGQYDLLVPEMAEPTLPARRAPAPAAPSVLFVGVNIVEMERRFGFVPADFALWVAVHEVTHRFQFVGVPWLRERFMSLVARYLESMDLDPRTIAASVAGAAARVASRTVPPEEMNPVYLMASDEQRALLDSIQALMAVVEGHGNFVMDAVGARVIPTFGRMRAVFVRRRDQVNLVQRVVHNAIGLEMKLRQYELGQRFCDGVAAASGRDGLSALWSSPDNLPTLAELREPDRWLRRVAA